MIFCLAPSSFLLHSLTSPTPSSNSSRDLSRGALQTLDALCDRLELAQKNLLGKNEAMLKSVSGALSALNPLSVLSRGYSAAFSADGRVIKNAADLSVGDRIKLRMLGGSIDASVDNVQLDEK